MALLLVGIASACGPTTPIAHAKAGWFTGSASSFIGGDRIHPTDEGHRHIANLLIPYVTKMLPAGYIIPKP